MRYNPFYFGGVVGEEDFCNRKRELSALEKDALSGINVLIYAPRRFGKTSLLFMLSDRLKAHGVKTIYTDLFPVTSEEEFIKLYFSSVASSIESRADKVMRLLKNTLNFKPSFSINVDREGNTTFSLHVERGEKDRTFEEVVNLPFVYAQKTGRKLCVVFDEFQEVYRLGLSAKLRSAIQKHSRGVAYVFSGSRRSILEKMFSDRREPFYRSVKKFPLEPIPEEDWIPFIKGKFEETKKHIPDTLIRRGVRLFGGHPHVVQQFFHFVWEETGKSVDEKVFERALDMLIESEKDTFWYLWEELTNIQRKVLKLVAYTDGRELYRRENLEMFSLSANLVQKSIRSLIERDVLDKKDGRIVFQNPLMKLWLVRVFS